MTPKIDLTGIVTRKPADYKQNTSIHLILSLSKDDVVRRLGSGAILRQAQDEVESQAQDETFAPLLFTAPGLVPGMQVHRVIRKDHRL